MTARAGGVPGRGRARPSSTVKLHAHDRHRALPRRAVDAPWRPNPCADTTTSTVATAPTDPDILDRVLELHRRFAADQARKARRALRSLSP